MCHMRYFSYKKLCRLFVLFSIPLSLSGCGGTGNNSTYIISEGAEEEGVAWAVPKEPKR